MKDKMTAALEADPELCNKILGFLGYDATNDGGTRWRISSKETGNVLFNMFSAASKADAVSQILGHEWIPNGSECPRCDDEYQLKRLKEISYVRNLFYGRSLDEIKIMLDLLDAPSWV